MSLLPSNSRQLIGLFDANKFYVSCEFIFRPDLWGRPAVVLSNNDSCAIAFNDEAKQALGLRMARPWFEVEAEARKLGVIVFSSHYELYANVSNRFMATLANFSPHQEIYSIDESFLDVTMLNRNLTELGQEIKNTVYQWVPRLKICAGFYYTKTGAKLANHCAKKQPIWNGVCDLTDLSETELNGILENLAVDTVWGVGRQLAKRLNELGVHNVLRLKNASCKRIRDEFGVVLERTVKELNGEPWLQLENELPEAKQVMSSRSFGARVHKLSDLQEAITYHAENASRRMREKGLYANAVYVFAMNSPFDQAEHYYGSRAVQLEYTTDSSIKINQKALQLLEQVYRPGVYYQKAGVMLMDTVPKEGQQLSLLGGSDGNAKESKLSATMDSLNKRYGRGTIRLASQGFDQQWSMQRAFKSPNYLGNWDEIPQVK